MSKHQYEILTSNTERKKRSWVGYFDGACGRTLTPNSGKMAIGAALMRDGEIIATRSERIEERGTSNIAEYLALIALLEMCITHDAENVLICGDSQLVLFQLSGKYKVRKQHLWEHWNRAWSLLKRIPGVKICWVGREENTLADRLSKGL